MGAGDQAEPKNRLTTTVNSKALRTGMLTRAAEIVGHARLSAAMGIKDRSFRSKLSSDRGISDADLQLVAIALDQRAAAAIAQAEAIRSILAPQVAP